MKPRWTALLLVSLLMFLPVASAQLTVSDDTYVLPSTKTATNNGISKSLAVQAPGVNSYLKFALNLPNAYTPDHVQSVKLRLYVSGATNGGTFDVARVTGSWSESSLTTTNPPALGASLVTSIQVPVTAKNSFIVVDVSPALIEWLQGNPNNGLALVPSSGSSISVTFSSKEDTGHEPALVLILDAATTTALNSEISRAQSTEAAISTNLSGEISRAEAADSALSQSLSTESTARAAGDAALANSISTIGTNFARLNANNTFTTGQAINGDLNVSGQLNANLSGTASLSSLSTYDNYPWRDSVVFRADRANGFANLRLTLSGQNQGDYYAGLAVSQAIDHGQGAYFTVGASTAGSQYYFHPNSLTIAVGDAGGQGKIIFNTASRDSNALVIDHSGFVGIGTGSPAQALDVAGNVRAISFIGDGSGLTNIAAASAANAQHAVTADSATVAGSAATAAFATNANSLGNVLAGNYARLDIGNAFTNTNTFSGNVGIGTAVPQYTLDILAPSTQGLRVLTDNGGKDAYALLTNGGHGHLQFLSGNSNGGNGTGVSGNSMINFRNNHDLVFTSSTDETNPGVSTGLMTIQGNNGNVGIGTASPAQKLDVAGNVHSNGNISADGTVTGSHFAGDGSGLTNVSAGMAVSAQHASTADSAAVAGSASIAGTANDSSNLGGVEAANYARTDVGNQFNGNQGVQGNLGIGTTTPGQNVPGISYDLSSFGARVLHVKHPNYASRVTIEGSDPYTDWINPGSAPNERWLAFLNHDGTGSFESIADDASHAVVFNILTMRLATGNVGVGTPSPQEKLDVAGNVHATGNVSAASFVGDGSGLTNVTAGMAVSAQHASTADSATVAGSAATAGSATNFFGALSGDVTGTQNATQVVALRGTPVSSAAPSDGEVLRYSSSTNQWVPSPAPVTAPAANAPINPQQVALLRWYGANQTTTFAVGTAPWALAFDGANIWSSNTGSGSVTELRASDGMRIGDFATGGSTSTGIAFDGSNIWVANSGSGTVSKLRASDGSILGIFNVGSTPYGVAFDGSSIWVVNHSSDNVTKLRASDGFVLGTFPVGAAPIQIAFDGANIWVTSSGSTILTKLATDGSQAGSFDLGSSQGGIAFDGASIWVATAGNTVTKVRASNGSKQGTFAVGSNPDLLAFDGANIWVTNNGSASVTKLRASDGTVLSTFQTGSNPQGIAFDGANVWVGNVSANTVSKL